MKTIYIILGYLFFAIGFVGAFLPLLPTVPFMILAAYFFHKGSPRLYHWLLSLPKVGPAIHEWNTHKVIRPQAKILACTMIIIGVAQPIAMNLRVPVPGKIMMLLIGATLVTFISTRSGRPD